MKTCVNKSFALKRLRNALRGDLQSMAAKGAYPNLLGKDPAYFKEKGRFRLPDYMTMDFMSEYYDFSALTLEETWFLKTKGCFSKLNPDEKKRVEELTGFKLNPSMEDIALLCVCYFNDKTRKLTADKDEMMDCDDDSGLPVKSYFNDKKQNLQNIEKIKESKEHAMIILKTIAQEGYLDLLENLFSFKDLEDKEIDYMAQSGLFSDLSAYDRLWFAEKLLGLNSRTVVKLGFYPNLHKAGREYFEERIRLKANNAGYDNLSSHEGGHYFISPDKDFDYVAKTFRLSGLMPEEIQYLKSNGWFDDLLPAGISYLKKHGILLNTSMHGYSDLLNKGKIALLERNGYCSRTFSSYFDNRGKLKRLGELPLAEPLFVEEIDYLKETLVWDKLSQDSRSAILSLK